MKRAWKWFKRIVLGTLAFVLLAIIVVLVLVHTDWGRNKVRKIALSIASDFFPGGINIERIDGSVLGTIEVTNVTINGLDGKKMIHVKKARVNLELTALLSKTISLEVAELDGVEVIDPSNPTKLPPEPGTWDVSIPNIKVHHANIALSGEEPMTFQDVDVDAGFTKKVVGGLVADARAIKGTWKERGLPFVVKAKAVVGDTAPEVTMLDATFGSTHVTGKGIVIDLKQPVASLTVHATPDVVAKLVPNFALPEAADLQIDISRAGAESKLELHGKMGTATLDAELQGVLKLEEKASTARGFIAANGVNIQYFVPRLTGAGSGVVSLVFDEAKQRAHALVIARGQLLDLPAGHALIDFDGAFEGESNVMLIAGGDGGLGTAAFGQMKKTGNLIEVLDAEVITSVVDASKVSAKKVPFKGALSAGGRAKGTLAPELSLELDGHVYGYGLSATDPKMRGLGIQQVTGKAEAKITEAGTFTHLKATLKNVSRAGELLGTFDVDARNRKDGTIVAKLTAHPAMLAQSTAEIGATITLPKEETDPIVIALDDHSIVTPRVKWGGTGGTVVITDDKITIKDIKSGSGNASLTADATIITATQAIDVKAKLLRVPMAIFDPKYNGTVSADVDMKRTGILWNGKATVTANGLQLGPDKPVIEAKAAVTIANRHVTADVNVSTFQVGAVRLVVDVEGPRDLTDPLGWRRLERKAIKTAMVALTRIDLAAAKVKTGGVVDGELAITGMDASGTFAIRGVQTIAGPIEGDINFAPMGDDLGVNSSIKVGSFGTAQIAAQIAIPHHPFEPSEWKKLGRGVVKMMTASIENVKLDSTALAPFGIVTPFSAVASANVTLSAGTSQAKATLDVRNIKGGILQRPIDLRVEGKIEAQNTMATVEARASNPGEWTDADPRLVKVNASLPAFGFDRWIADAANVKNQAVAGTLEIPNIDVVEALAMIGRKDVKTGKVNGTINVAGIVSKPTATGKIVVSNVTVEPKLKSKTKLPALTTLEIIPAWNGSEAELTIKGKEDDGATLDITARVRPDDLKAITASVIIKKFDVTPIAVFMPGPLVAATGKINANITIRGASIDKIRGSFSIEKGRVPVHPQVGTVRDANLTVNLTDAGLKYDLSAKMGSGTIKLKGDAPPDLQRVRLEGNIDKLSPIGSVQPIISARLDGTIFHEEGLVRSEIKLTKTRVDLDLEQGVELLPSEMPADMFLNRTTAPPPTPKQARLPRKPWFTIKLLIDTTPIDVKHEFFRVLAKVNAKKGITVSVGRTIGLDGSIEIERGDVDVVGRHYRVDPGPDKIRFDGSIDPLLAIRLSHDFPELTLTADITGRAIAKRDINMTGTPNIYTQDELVAFFIGGDPAGGSSNATRDVASSAGAAYLNAKLARHAKKVIPIKVDVLACKPGNSAKGASCQLGKWLTENWYLGYEQKIEPRADENPQEFQAQYYFRRNWIFEAAGFAERFGGDVLWRKRW